MAEDYFSDAEGDDSQSSSSEAAKPKTALLPLSFFEQKELEPGKVCKIKVESVQDDQVEVSYVRHVEDESEEEMPMEIPEDDLMA